MSEVGQPEPGTGSPVRVLPLRTTIGHLVRLAHQVHTALWMRELNGDVTGPQTAILAVLSGRGGLDQRTVGRLASLDKSTTADVVARLHRTGWIVRERDQNDGRRDLLHLSPAARVALHGIATRGQHAQDLLMAPLADADRPVFLELLGRVAYQGRTPLVDVSAPVAGVPSAAERLHWSLATAPGHLLRRTLQVHTVLWSSQVRSSMTPPQYAVLSALAGGEGLDQTTVGNFASLDKSSTASVVARLSRRKLIERSRDPGDARRNVLRLTAAAAEFLLLVTPQVEEVQVGLLAPLSPGEREQLVVLMQQIAYR